MRFCATLLLMLATPVAAQDLVFNDKIINACLSAATDQNAASDCAGQAADACMEATPGGFSTVGIGGCLDRELQVWDAMLNAEYQRVRADAAGVDGEQTQDGLSAPSIADALRDMQRAWITFRDARCSFEAAQWGGGTGAGPAYVSCILSMTADQALTLRDMQIVY